MLHRLDHKRDPTKRHHKSSRPMSVPIGRNNTIQTSRWLHQHAMHHGEARLLSCACAAARSVTAEKTSVDAGAAPARDSTRSESEGIAFSSSLCTLLSPAATLRAAPSLFLSGLSFSGAAPISGSPVASAGLHSASLMSICAPHRGRYHSYFSAAS